MSNLKVGEFCINKDCGKLATKTGFCKECSVGRTRDEINKDIIKLLPSFSSITVNGYMGYGYIAKDRLLRIEQELIRLKSTGVKH